VFLVHFPVCLVVNAAFTRFVSEQAHVQAFGMVVAWGVSPAAGELFHRWVEAPLGRALKGFAAPAVPRPFSGNLGDMRSRHIARLRLYR
jgi:peptidoglycan/LPS O-acetylase OafA/YrhL